MYWISTQILETAMVFLTKNLEMHLFFAAKKPNEITCASVTPGIRETCHLGGGNGNCGCHPLPSPRQGISGLGRAPERM